MVTTAAVVKMSESVDKSEKRNRVRFLERIFSQVQALKTKRLLRRWKGVSDRPICSSSREIGERATDKSVFKDVFISVRSTVDREYHRVRLRQVKAEDSLNTKISRLTGAIYRFCLFGLGSGCGDIQPHVSSQHKLSQIPKHWSGTGVSSGQG